MLDNGQRDDLKLMLDLDGLADRLAAQVADLVREEAQQERSPWMTKDEAIAYSKIPRGTFEEMSADGRIPAYGGKTKRYHRDELDAAIRRS